MKQVTANIITLSSMFLTFFILLSLYMTNIFTCSNNSYTYCNRYQSANITIISRENINFIGKYYINSINMKCKILGLDINSVNERDIIGTSPNLYYKSDQYDICATKKYRDEYILDKDSSSKIGSLLFCSIPLFIFIIFIINFCYVIMKINYDKYNTQEVNTVIPNNQYNPLQTSGDVELGSSFKNLSQQLETNHTITTPDLNDNCVICLSKFNEENTQLIALECNHWFHKKCMNEFRKNNKIKKCPLCKK